MTDVWEAADQPSPEEAERGHSLGVDEAVDRLWVLT